MTEAMIIMTSSLRARSLRTAFVLGVALVAVARPATAQLDPLLFLKTVPPNVLVAVDASLRMQRDADETYYDPRDYTRRSRPFEPSIGVTAANSTQYYRRTYLELTPSGGSGTQFTTRSIQSVGDTNPSFAAFYARTRLGVARIGVRTAIFQNQAVARYALLKMRQASPTLSTAGDGSSGNGGRTTNADGTQASPTDLSGSEWSLNLPLVGGTNSSLGAITAPLVTADAVNQNSSILNILQRQPSTAGAILAAGRDTSNDVDAPVDNLLDDARAEAARLIAADTMCRNTIVVLVVGGGEGTLTAESLSAKASTFLNVSGRRVPIYVVAIAPNASAETQLRAVATNSGGQFFLITKEMIDGVPAGSPVPEVVRAVNLATQHAFVAQSLFDQLPTVALPFGKSEEYQVTSPITGTVNLEGASDINGVPLPNTSISSGAGAAIPQRQNLTVTSGFSLPGFDGKLRAFRMYEPVADTTKPTGYRFVQPTTPVRLWVASAPAAADRNIFTVLPDGTMVRFDASQAATLAPYLRTTDPARLIAFIRSQPIGAVVGSTPAIMDAPSLDPPPDAAYPAFKDDNKNRRSMLFVGTNDGMLHAIDARLGLETWAFIPFNLLPKLRMLEYGQPVGDFNYFVDSSAKVADVKVGTEWKTYLFVGQGPGGTYYNTFDVTLDGMSGSVSPTTASAATLLSYFSSPSRITRRWSFPRDSVFDWTIATHGDVGATATAIEKTVGETWSDPAVGQVQSSSAPWVVFVGSGFFKPSWQARPNRAGVNAGTTFYLLDAVTGAVLDSRDVGTDALGETIDNCAAANNCTRIKNALQMDPVATGPVDSRYVAKAYIGDLDGRVWRLSFTLNGAGVPQINGAPQRLYDATAAHPLFSSMAIVNEGAITQYLFVGTGSDLLPSNGVAQSYSMLVLQDAGGSSAVKTAEILLARTDGLAGDEKVTAFPSVAQDIVFFTTTTTFPTTPCGDRFSANLYAINYKTGGPAYDTDGDGAVRSTTTGGGKKAVTTYTDNTKVATVAGKRATAPFVVDQHLVFSAGNNMQLFGDPQDYNNGVGQVAVRILSWRDVK